MVVPCAKNSISPGATPRAMKRDEAVEHAERRVLRRARHLLDQELAARLCRAARGRCGCRPRRRRAGSAPSARSWRAPDGMRQHVRGRASGARARALVLIETRERRAKTEHRAGALRMRTFTGGTFVAVSLPCLERTGAVNRRRRSDRRLLPRQVDQHDHRDRAGRRLRPARAAGRPPHGPPHPGQSDHRAAQHAGRRRHPGRELHGQRRAARTARRCTPSCRTCRPIRRSAAPASSSTPASSSGSATPPTRPTSSTPGIPPASGRSRM